MILFNSWNEDWHNENGNQGPEVGTKYIQLGSEKKAWSQNKHYINGDTLSGDIRP